MSGYKRAHSTNEVQTNSLNFTRLLKDFRTWFAEISVPLVAIRYQRNFFPREMNSKILPYTQYSTLEEGEAEILVMLYLANTILFLYAMYHNKYY